VGLSGIGNGGVGVCMHQDVSIIVNMAIQHSSLKLEMGTTELLVRNTALTMMLMLLACTKRRVFLVFFQHSASSAQMSLTTTLMAHVAEVFAYSLSEESMRFNMPALANASWFAVCGCDVAWLHEKRSTNNAVVATIAVECSVLPTVICMLLLTYMTHFATLGIVPRLFEAMCASTRHPFSCIKFDSSNFFMEIKQLFSSHPNVIQA